MRDPGTPRPPTLELSQLQPAEKFFQSIEASLIGKAPAPIAAVFNANVEGNRKITGPDTPSGGHIQSLTFHGSITLTLSGLSIKTLDIRGHGVQIRANNCAIGELIVSAQGVNAEIRLNQCSVGTLRVVPGALGHYEMRGGCLLNVACPPPGPSNPFTGTVSFTKDVFFPRRRNMYILAGPQPYRNMRYHLRRLENAQMANLIHSAELAVEREDDSLMNRILSHLYEWMSDFGSSALRPLVWQGVLFVLSFSLILYSDGAVQASRDTEFVGWQQVLIDPRWGACARAAYLAVQPLVNPIGIFGPKSVLIPRSAWLAVWLSVAGILGIVLLALFIFAIRRRFKIQM